VARKIENIQAEIIAQKEATPELSALSSTSKTAVWRLWTYIIATAIYSLEVLWDNFRVEINKTIAEGKIHTKHWYRQKALDFQYGFSIIEGTDKFDNSGATQEQVANSKIVKQAACVKLISSNGWGILRIKVATGAPAPLNSEELTTLNAYFQNHVADAGTYLIVTSNLPDMLALKLDIYYDPLVLNHLGERLDGTDNTPVKSEIIRFLKSLEFNGALIISDLTAKLRQIEGVKIAVCKEARSKYGNYNYNQTGVANVGLIDEIRIADAGYMKLDEAHCVFNYKKFEQ